MSVDDLATIARDLKLTPEKVEKTVQLLDDGNTIPFITRFRKDETGGLNEKQIQAIKQFVQRKRAIEERRSFILKSIASQAKLTDQLKSEIERAHSPRYLEDLYIPFKPKRQSLATTARQQGLEPFAEEIFEGQSSEVDLAALATQFVRVDKGLSTVDDVIAGVGRIVAEKFSDNRQLRAELRKIVWNTGQLISTLVETPDSQTTANDPPQKSEPVATDPVESTDKPNATTTELKSAMPAAENSAATEPGNQTDTAASVAPVVSVNEEKQAAPAEPTPTADATPAAEATPTAEATPAATAEATPTSEVTAAPAEDRAPVAESSSPSTAPPDGTSEATQLTETTVQTENAAKTEIAEPDRVEKSAEQTNTTEPTQAPKKKKKKRKKKTAPDPFRDYFDFKQPIKNVPHHRVLAINRGERAGKLKVKIEVNADQVSEKAKSILISDGHPSTAFMEKCALDAVTRIVIPSLEREARRELSESAEIHAVEVFASNLRNLLLQPPIANHRILAIDPGFKRGCTVAAIDENGALLETGKIFVVGNLQRREESGNKIQQLIEKHSIRIIAVGNGAACRETEQLVSDLLAGKLAGTDVKYIILNEAGASTYSTSEIGREELPELSPDERSAVSIGRRLLDPLSELVKISPANIGVGMYQHDVKAKHLSESLDDVVRFCVNRVGVNVNTASPSLLRYVSGLNQLTARRVYEYRKEKGPFTNRQQLKQVTGFGDATFVQAAGFLRILDGDDPLEATPIHPESLETAEKILAKIGASTGTLFDPPPAKTVESPPPIVQTSDIGATDSPGTEKPISPTDSGVAAPMPQPPADEAASQSSESKPEITSPAQPQPSPTRPGRDSQRSAVLARLKELKIEDLANEFGVGKMLIRDIIRTFSQPRRDPRDGVSKPIFRKGIIKVDDLKVDMQLDAQVVNVVDFGVFVDIGLGESSLIHVSQLSNRYIQNPHQFFAIGDVLKVWVSEVDGERRRVKLTAVKPGTPKFDPSKSRQRRDRQDKRPSHARPPRANVNKGRGKPTNTKTYQTRGRPPKKATPITEAMLDGKEPMRSFSDLLQFVEKKPETDADKKNEG